ncbi:MAG: 5-formyltetrahydrofolate cyclo-ligase [archaeon]
MKDIIRSRMRGLRDKLPEAEAVSRSSAIERRLFSLAEFQNAASVMFYLSKGNEVKTDSMIAGCLGRKRVAVPVTDQGRGNLLISSIESLERLKLSSFGVREPLDYKPVPAGNLDLVIVPGMAFDRSGNRIGYGGGYYDSFLRGISGIPIVGLAYDFQIVGHLDVRKTDVPVDLIITENETIRCVRC